MMKPTEQYKYDSKFRQIVDILRDELRRYEFTPSELRQAVILAATMHAEQNIRPIIYMDEAKLIPSMFGGLIGKFDVRDFTEQVKERRIGVANRRVSVKLGRNKSTGDRRKHIHDFKYTGRGYDVCGCGISSVYYSATKPKTATGSNL